MAKICFVTYEIYPTTIGGAGVLYYNAAHLLLRQGHEIIFLLDIPYEHFNLFIEKDRFEFPNPVSCRAYHVGTLCADLTLSPDNFSTTFAWRAYCFHYAAHKVYNIEQPDVIEFVDYTAAGLYALSSKVAGLAFQNSTLAVRLHNSIEVMDLHDASRVLNFHEYILYGLERQALRLAEKILYPSQLFLEEAYQPIYETWFGETVYSPPPLLWHPNRAFVQENADLVLYYGRLFSWKGVDRFVDAALLYLSDPNNPPVRFTLVGYDSMSPPIPTGSYQAYLERKIPTRWRNAFTFTGQLSWQELEDLLPSVKFAVFPNYFESFCYAAHELYAAGIPLIVSSIPAFRGSFVNNENALFFDGSITDLAAQMKRLSRDSELRSKISFPYPIVDNSLAGSYTALSKQSWISPFSRDNHLKILIGVLSDSSQENLDQTLHNLALTNQEQEEIIVFRQAGEQAEQGVWFLGNFWMVENSSGKQISIHSVFTCDAFLLMRAGDKVDPAFLKIGRGVLACQEEINYVASWQMVEKQDRKKVVSTFHIDAIPEILPFYGLQTLSRAIFRTHSGQSLLDLFDPHAGSWGEIVHLLDLTLDNKIGLVIPEPLYERSEECEKASPAFLTYLINRGSSVYKLRRFAQHSISLLCSLNDAVKARPIEINLTEEKAEPEDENQLPPGWRGWVRGQVRRMSNYRFVGFILSPLMRFRILRKVLAKII